MSEPGKAVFLSYASQDAEVVARIAESLRASGVEVWFDVEGGLETGDEWDAKIRRQIKECILFAPIISANTQARLEGYFRIEWELAAERAMGVASGVPFILPVVIDDTREPEALVPDRFRRVQWTRAPGGELTAEMTRRFAKLWSHRVGAAGHAAARAYAPVASLEASALAPARARPRRRWLVALAVAASLGALGAGGYVGWRWYYQQQEAAVLAAFGIEPEAKIKKEGRVLVARFENSSGDPLLDGIGQAVADHVRRRVNALPWVREGVGLKDAERLTPESTLAEMRALAERSGADVLVTGDYHREGERVVLHGRVFDLKMARIFAELAPIAGPVTAPADTVEETAERLVGITGSVPRVRRGREDVTKFVNFAVPRRYDAVEIQEGASEDPSRYRRAYERDPRGALSSLVLLAFHHIAREHYAEADAVLGEVATKDMQGLPEYVRLLAAWARASAGGDGVGVENAVASLRQLMPSSRYWRTEWINVLYRANKPEAICREFAGVKPGSPAEKIVAVWHGRASAAFLQQDLATIEAAARMMLKLEPENERGMQFLLFAHAQRRDLASVIRLLDDYDGLRRKEFTEGFSFYVTALACLRHAGLAGKAEYAQVVRRAERWFEGRTPAEAASLAMRLARTEMLYLAGRYAEARAMAETLLAENPDDVRVRSFVATAAIRLGDRATAEATSAWLRGLDPRYRFGYAHFAQAKIAALLGDEEEALRLLREAFAQHSVSLKDFSWEGLIVSPDFESLRTNPRFQDFLKPRG